MDPDLTNRETVLLSLVVQGWSDEELAEMMRVEPRIVRRMISDLQRRWDCYTREELQDAARLKLSA